MIKTIEDAKPILREVERLINERSALASKYQASGHPNMRVEALPMNISHLADLYIEAAYERDAPEPPRTA